MPVGGEIHAVMNNALKEARRFGHPCLQSEHVLLGLLLEDSCSAAAMLKEHLLLAVLDEGGDVVRRILDACNIRTTVLRQAMIARMKI
jgi:hypothetical protein